MENIKEKEMNDRTENNLSCRWMYKKNIVKYLRTVRLITWLMGYSM